MATNTEVNDLLKRFDPSYPLAGRGVTYQLKRNHLIDLGVLDSAGKVLGTASEAPQLSRGRPVQKTKVVPGRHKSRAAEQARLRNERSTLIRSTSPAPRQPAKKPVTPKQPAKTPITPKQPAKKPITPKKPAKKPVTPKKQEKKESQTKVITPPVAGVPLNGGKRRIPRAIAASGEVKAEKRFSPSWHASMDALSRVSGHLSPIRPSSQDLMHVSPVRYETSPDNIEWYNKVVAAIDPPHIDIDNPVFYNPNLTYKNIYTELNLDDQYDPKLALIRAIRHGDTLVTIVRGLLSAHRFPLKVLLDAYEAALLQGGPGLYGENNSDVPGALEILRDLEGTDARIVQNLEPRHLKAAAIGGDYETVEHILKTGSFDYSDLEEALSEVFQRVERGFPDDLDQIALLLIEAGADPAHAPDALALAAYHGYSDVVDVIIDKASDLGLLRDVGIETLKILEEEDPSSESLVILRESNPNTWGSE